MPGGYARDRRTVGEAVGAGLVNRIRREFLGHRFPRERRVVQIDAGVDETDGHPGTGLGVRALQQAQIAVGLVRLDVAQPPLVLEILVQAVLLDELRCRLREYLRRDAVSLVDRDALRG